MYPTRSPAWFAADFKDLQLLNTPEEYKYHFDASTATDTGEVTTACLRDLVLDSMYFCD